VQHRPTVCIVDDDSSLRHALARLLRGLGFEVDAFAEAKEVLRRLEAGSLQCTIVVLDINLGDMSGFDLHDRLTKLGRSVPTIFMTGCDDAGHRERVAHLAAASYLVKPFEELDLIDAIAEAVQKH
jgi:FixJ family two-component response regulator